MPFLINITKIHRIESYMSSKIHGVESYMSSGKHGPTVRRDLRVTIVIFFMPWLHVVLLPGVVVTSSNFQALTALYSEMDRKIDEHENSTFI